MSIVKKGKFFSLISACVVSASLLVAASASATIVTLNGTERTDSTGLIGNGWSVVTPASGSATDNRTPLILNLTIDDSAAYYDFLFVESSTQQALETSFGLRTLNMGIGIQNTSSSTITALHFTLIDPNAPSPIGLPPFHLTSAHFHYGAPVLTGTATSFGTVGATTDAVTSINLTDSFLESGQNLFFTAGSGFGIHQYEVEGQDRSFILRISADLLSTSPNPVSLPGSLPLLVAGLMAMGYMRKQIRSDNN